MRYVLTWVLYALLKVDCPSDSVDHSCFTKEPIDTVRKEFKTVAAAKGYVTKAKNNNSAFQVDGKTLLSTEDGFIEYLKIDTVKN